MGKSIKPTNQQGKKGTDGRPKADLDYETLKECARIHCTVEEAAGVCRVSADTIERHLRADFDMSWADFYAAHSAEGKMSLRRSLFKTALGQEEDKKAGKQAVSPNVTALIWLSKQHLGMKDKTEHGFDPDQPAKFVLNLGKKLDKGDDL